MTFIKRPNILTLLPALLFGLLVVMLAVFLYRSESIEQVYLERVQSDIRERTYLLLPPCRGHAPRTQAGKIAGPLAQQ